MHQTQSVFREPQSKKRIEQSPVHKDIDSRWVQLKFTNSFAPRSYFASCIQAGNVYIHGGFSAQTGSKKDLLVCSMHQNPATWKTITPKNSKVSPPTLRNHTLNSYYSQLILVGGQQNVIQNNGQIFRFDLLSNSWSICKCLDEKGQPFPYALDSHSTFIYKNFMYIIGGYDSRSTVYSNVVIQISLEKIAEDLLSYRIINSETGPSRRANASCCLVRNQIYMFGGGNIEQVCDDLWIFNIQTEIWHEVTKMPENITWPEKRKGSTLILHEQSGCLFLFGGIKKVTKQHNDIFVWTTEKKRWVKIHSNTNQLYDPSPTVKDQTESPTIIEQKRKREKAKTMHGTFKLGIRTVSQSESFNKFHETSADFLKRQSSQKPPGETINGNFQRKMSVVQQKKYRQFLNRKKKLLGNIESAFDKTKEKRSHSPTSEALLFSLNSMGEQTRNQKSDMNLPKVIYDQEKGQVIGKKPCARDGHAALVYDGCMLILGGDRHMVSFNDAYLFKLNKGVESMPLYE